MEDAKIEQEIEPAKPAIPGVQVGRIVHYVPNLPDRLGREHIAGIIVRVWDHHSGCVNLRLFVDGATESFYDEHKTSRVYSELHEPGTWHFPERA